MLFDNLEMLLAEQASDFFNEYDKSNFVYNAQNRLLSITADYAISTKGNYCVDMLQKARNCLNTIVLDSFAISEFINNILGSGRVDSAGIKMKEIDTFSTIVFKPQYLQEAISSTNVILNRIVSGEYDTGEIKKLCLECDEYCTALKKRCIVSPMSSREYEQSISGLLEYKSAQLVPVTTSYLESSVLKFLRDFPKRKKILSNEFDVVLQSVKYNIGVLNQCVNDYSSKIATGTVDPKTVSISSNFIYNRVRAIMDAITFISFAMMRKMHRFEEQIISIQDMYNQLNLVFADVKPMLEYGTFDNRVISATDSKNMAEELIDGKNGVYAELANNIIEYHKGAIGIHCGLSNTDVSGEDAWNIFDSIKERYGYDKNVYLNIIKAYCEISSGLDVLAKNSDDYLMVFDELIKKSGFVIALQERFVNEINALEDTQNYNLANIDLGNNSAKQEVYYQLLSEIFAYSENTQSIAKVVRDVFVKLNYVKSLFYDNKNGELEYSETMNELKIFIDDLLEQFNDMTSKVAANLYKRLKLLASKADMCVEGSTEEEIDNPVSSPEYSEDDFFKEATVIGIKFSEEYNDLIMESLMKEYYSLRELKERGVRLVFEDGEPTVQQTTTTTQPTTTTNNTTTNTQQNQNNKNETKPTVTDNSNQNNNGSNTQSKIKSLIEKIKQQFAKMMESFTQMVERQKAKNLKWLSENKEALLNRSYTNVQINLLPYGDGMPYKRILQDVNKMLANERAVARNLLQPNSYNSYEDIRNALINFGPKFDKKDMDEKTVITNFYKVGTMALETVTYSNNEIKTIVANEMIPFCDDFYTDNYETVKQLYGSAKDALDLAANKSYTEAVEAHIVKSSKVLLEADGQTTTTNTTTNATVSDNNSKADPATKLQWATRCCISFYGSVLNALRDRNNDYLKVLAALAPNKSNNNQQNNQQQQPQQQEQPPAQ